MPKRPESNGKCGLISRRAGVPVLLSLAIGLLCTPAIGRQPDSPRPNILFLIGDNWAWPHASVLGDPTVKTPVFDRIVREGTLFTHAFCPVPSCSPARTSLLTGRAAHQLREAASLYGIFRKCDAFPEMLEKSGYDIGHVGKGFHPPDFRKHGWTQLPLGRRYAEFDEFMEQRDSNKPFFFWFGSVDVALGRWRYGPEGWEGADPDSVVVPPNLPDTPAVRETMLAYYGGVVRQDQAFGRAVARLEKDGLLDDTLVIYSSDNGWQMPRGLANCYDGGTHIPMAMRWGDRLQPGRRIEQFVSLTDFAPTFLELAGVPIPANMTGTSFSGLFFNARSHVRQNVGSLRSGDRS